MNVQIRMRMKRSLLDVITDINSTQTDYKVYSNLRPLMHKLKSATNQLHRTHTKWHTDGKQQTKEVMNNNKGRKHLWCTKWTSILFIEVRMTDCSCIYNVLKSFWSVHAHDYMHVLWRHNGIVNTYTSLQCVWKRLGHIIEWRTHHKRSSESQLLARMIKKYHVSVIIWFIDSFVILQD